MPSAYRIDLQKFFPLLLIVAGLAVYHNSLSGAFVFDDRLAIVENPRIGTLWLSWSALRTPTVGPTAGRPLVHFSLALNYALGRLDVFGYHLFNLLVHLLTGLLVYGTVRRTLGSERLKDRFGSSAAGLALAMALLWEVHPLLTESVSYVTQRTELLMGFFFLLTLYCSIRGFESEHARRWQAAAIVACALGMSSKEVMVSAPLVVWVYDRCFFAGTFREAVRRRWPFYSGLAVTWLVLVVLVSPGHHREVVGFEFGRLSWWSYLLTQGGVIVHYLRLSLWPYPLSLSYADWPIAKQISDAFGPALLVVALLGLTMWALWKRRPFGFLGAWFFLILAPTSSVLPMLTEVVAERRMYLPLAAVIAGMVGSVYVLFRRLSIRQLLSQPSVTVLRVLLLVVVASGLGAMTILRNEHYQSEEAIWRETVRQRPANPQAHYDLGGVLARQRRDGEAEREFREALRIKPTYTDAGSALGLILLRQGKTDEATAYLQKVYDSLKDRRAHAPPPMPAMPQAARSVDIAFAEASSNLGISWMQRGQFRTAESFFREALTAKPDFTTAVFNLGLVCENLGRWSEAESEYRKVVGKSPNDASASYHFGLALAHNGHLAAAREQLLHAAQLQPDWPQPFLKLAWFTATTTALTPDAEQAVGWAKHAALLVNVPDAETLDTLAAAYAAAGRFEDAIRTAQDALKIARSASSTITAQEIQKRLDLYKAHRPYRENSPTPKGD